MCDGLGTSQFIYIPFSCETASKLTFIAKTEMFTEGKMVERCGCVTACRRMSSLVVLLQMDLELKDGTKLSVNNFSSKAFTNLFLTNGVPNGIVVSMSNTNDRKRRSWQARMINAIRFINGKNGFNVSG